MLTLFCCYNQTFAVYNFNEKNRKLAYQEAPRKIKLQVQKTNKRIREKKETNNKQDEMVDEVKEKEKQAYNVLIGQLKLAEIIYKSYKLLLNVCFIY